MKTIDLTGFNYVFSNTIEFFTKLIKQQIYSFIYFSFCLAINTSLMSAGNLKIKPDTAKWRNPTGTILKVFTSSDKFKNREVLRLYEDFTYEYIFYERIPKFFQMKRETGKYTWHRNTLLLINNTNLKVHSTHYFGKYIFKKGKGLYQGKLDAVINKDNLCLEETENKKFHSAFYIDPDFGTIVMNKESPKKLDLSDLVKNLTKSCETDQQKIDIIVNFIQKSIDYDHKFVQKSADTKNIIAGRTRLGVCADYAKIIKDFLSYCGIDCEIATGSAKNSLSDIAIEVASNHAWNIITINGSKHIYDVCWSDSDGEKWLDVKPEVMIHSHYPDNPKHQLLNNPVSKSEFDHFPYLTHEKDKMIYQYFPIKAINYVNDVFTVTYDTIIRNVSVMNTNDFNIYNSVYRGEKNDKPNSINIYQVKNIEVKYDNGKTTVTIPISQQLNNIRLNFDGIELSYMVVKDSPKTLFEKYIKEYNPFQIDSYLRAVLSTLYLNDISKLKELVGETNHNFFNSKGKLDLKKNILNKIKTWDGLLSTAYLEITDMKYLKIKTCETEFTLDKNETGYFIVSIK